VKKILGLIKSQTIKDSFVVALGLGVSAVIGFFFTILLARSLGPVNFGVYSALTALAAIVYSLGDLGISSALINFLPKKISERYEYLSTSFWMEFAIGVFILLLFGILSLFFRQIVPGSLGTDIFLAGLLAFNYLLIIYTQGVFTADRRFWSYSASQIVDSAVKIMIVLAIFRLGNLSIGSALVANIISTLLALLITFGKVLNSIEFDFSKSSFWNIFHFAKWIAVSRIFTVMISRVDIVLLNLLVGSYSAGIFSAASRVTLLFAMTAAGLGSVINPRFSSFDNTQKILSYAKKLVLLVSGIAASMIAISFFASPIIILVYGEKYLESINVFRYLILAMIPFLFTIISNSVLVYSFNQLNYYTKMMAIQTAIIVGLDLLLIPKIGFQAPAIALFASNIFVLFASFFKVKTLLHEKP
jgi:O-antigen/teichoic acid export membrane protein